jgi:hypothetical protein
MAVVILHTQSEETRYLLHYEAFCSHCHRSLGRFDGEEIAWLCADAPLGVILCFDCEEARLEELLHEPTFDPLAPGVVQLLIDHGFI